MLAYTPGTNSWTTKAPLPSARSSLSGVGTINGVLYVAGGLSLVNGANVTTASLYAYTPSANTWAKKASMPVASAGGASGIIGGRLYVYSGGSAADPASFQRYDPATNTWQLLALPTSRHRLPAAGVIAGKFYVVGGLDNGVPSRAVEVYDPATNAWTPQPPMPTARYGAAGTVIDGLLYVGGPDGRAIAARGGGGLRSP